VKSGKDGEASDQTVPIPKEWLRDLLENEATGAECLPPEEVVLDEDDEAASGCEPRSPGATRGTFEGSTVSPVRSRPVRFLPRLHFDVSVHIVSDHNFFAGLTRDISEGGIFVATHLPFEVGTRLEIQLLLPSDAQPALLLTEVRWVRSYSATSGVSAGIGLKFVEPPAAVVARIHEFMNTRDPIYFET
jgi:uncharacterized protein (TIGR02266 family)